MNNIEKRKNTKIKLSLYILIISFLIGFFLLSFNGCYNNDENVWLVKKNGSILEIYYGKDYDFPQYAALHLDSSYFRMNYGPESGWGTSVILFPSFWEGGRLYQGAQIDSYSYEVSQLDNILVLQFMGDISSLNVSGKMNIYPPEKDSLVAEVQISVEGDISLDNRPGEAFKPVMLSSMHVSSDQWDAQLAYIDNQVFNIPSEGWIVSPPVQGSKFGLKGGYSQWQNINHQGPVPTLEVNLNTTFPVTGWVTPSSNPNDDNVGFWASSDKLMKCWKYTIIAKKAESTNANKYLKKIIGNLYDFLKFCGIL